MWHSATPRCIHTHTKFGIPTANNIGDVPEVNVKVTTNPYGTLWHPDMYPHSKFGIPTSKQYKIYVLGTIFLELGSEDKVKLTVIQKQYATLCDPKVYPHTKFGIPASNYISDMLRTQLRFRLTNEQIVSYLSSFHGAHHHLWLQTSAEPGAEPSDVNVKG